MVIDETKAGHMLIVVELGDGHGAGAGWVKRKQGTHEVNPNGLSSFTYQQVNGNIVSHECKHGCLCRMQNFM